MLIADGTLPFRIAVNTPAKIEALYGPDAPKVKFSFADRGTWGPALDGVETVFLLFPLPHPGTAKSWMLPFIAAAREAGVRHIIYLSVPTAGDTKLVPHHTVERAIEASGMAYTFLRAAFFSQNLCRDITTHAVDIARSDEIIVPAGKGVTSFVDSRDVAEVAVKVMREPAAHAGKAYVLTGPELLDYHQVAAIMSEELGRPIAYREPSVLRFWWTVGPRVTWDTLLFMTGVYILTRRGKNADMTDTLPQLLGRSPRTMRDFVRDYRDRFTGEAAKQAVKVKTPGLKMG
ncbi:MAG: hypothetical protein ABS48_01610 [Erythrobacter sp. SCN 68-10]|nr:MAG: hypothetical protein ABS48_01610 [Erythrobacter sp. SCN 68-10]